MSGLTAALGRLTLAFADVPRPAAIAACQCCLSAKQVSTLLAPVPLAELPAEVVLEYAAHAMGTIGAVDDFRYFLPRVLGLLLAPNRPAWPELEPVGEGLRAAAWTAWSPRERAAVRDVLRALWTQTLASHPSDPGVDTALCVVGIAEDSLTPYLDDWTAALRGGAWAAAAQLRELLHWSARSTGVSWRLTNGAWNQRDAPVVAWLGAEPTRAAVRAGFDAARAEETVDVYTDLAGLLGA